MYYYRRYGEGRECTADCPQKRAEDRAEQSDITKHGNAVKVTAFLDDKKGGGTW